MMKRIIEHFRNSPADLLYLMAVLLLLAMPFVARAIAIILPVVQP